MHAWMLPPIACRGPMTIAKSSDSAVTARGKPRPCRAALCWQLSQAQLLGVKAGLWKSHNPLVFAASALPCGNTFWAPMPSNSSTRIDIPLTAYLPYRIMVLAATTSSRVLTGLHISTGVTATTPTDERYAVFQVQNAVCLLVLSDIIASRGSDQVK